MTDYDLTDDSQIEQYLENIETEYSYQCLSEREPDGEFLRCILLAAL